MRLLENTITSSLFNTINEGILRRKADMSSMDLEDFIDKDFKTYLEDNNIKSVNEDDINDYFTGLFYEIEDEDDIELMNKAEDYIRDKYLNKELNESKSSKNKKKEKRVIMQQGNITCLKDGDKFYVYEDDNSNMSEYNNQDEAMRDALGRCGINPDNELKEPKK